MMEIFQNAKVVRFKSHHDKYLLANKDQEKVCQDSNGDHVNTRWVVEFIENDDSLLRFKSCYDKYLTASNVPFLLGMTGYKVLQTQPKRLDSSLDWEPVKQGSYLKFRTRYGQYLRANGGLPPWKNSITHDVPHRRRRNWVLWEVDILESRFQLAHQPLETQQTIKEIKTAPSDCLEQDDNPFANSPVKFGNINDKFDQISITENSRDVKTQTASDNILEGSTRRVPDTKVQRRKFSKLGDCWRVGK